MNTAPIYVFAKWKVKEGQLDTVLSLLEKVSEQSRREEGNLIYTLHQQADDHNTLLLYEAYKDQPALEAHRNSDHFQNIVLKTIVPLLESREVILSHAIG